jgi:hypothetical protein
VVGLSVVAALTRFVALSQGPWDWDEVLFCLAVGKYDVAMHQPHPAGFPLYIFLGKIARLVLDSDFHALQAINILAGIAAFPVVFALARSFRFDFVASVGAALVFAFLPNVWFYGGTAFSDLPAAVLFLGAIAAYVSSKTNVRRYFLASILLGAGALIRPQNIFVALFPWTIATVRLLRGRRVVAAISASLLVVLIVVTGYGAAASVTGVDRYFAAVKGHSEYVKRADAITAGTHPPLREVLRVQLDPYDAGKVSILLNLLALAAIVIGRRRVVAEVMLTFAPAFVFGTLVLHPLGVSRFSLNYIAMVVLLAVEGTTALARFIPRLASFDLHKMQIGFRVAVIAIIVGRFSTWTLPAFEEPRRTMPPPAAAAIWVSQHTPPESVVFADASIGPWARYFLPGRTVRSATPEEVVRDPASRDGWYLACGTSPREGAIHFLRPHDRTWNIVTRRGFEAFAQPARNVVSFADGWHWPEGDVDPWRWSKKNAAIEFAACEGLCELRLRYLLPLDAVGHPMTVKYSMNGAALGTTTQATMENEVRYIVRGRGNAANVLRIELSDAFVPAERGGNPDTRELGMMLRSWSWKPVGAAEGVKR